MYCFGVRGCDRFRFISIHHELFLFFFSSTRYEPIYRAFLSKHSSSRRNIFRVNSGRWVGPLSAGYLLLLLRFLWMEYCFLLAWTSPSLPLPSNHRKFLFRRLLAGSRVRVSVNGIRITNAAASTHCRLRTSRWCRCRPQHRPQKPPSHRKAKGWTVNTPVCHTASRNREKPLKSEGRAIHNSGLGDHDDEIHKRRMDGGEMTRNGGCPMGESDSPQKKPRRLNHDRRV